MPSEYSRRRFASLVAAGCVSAGSGCTTNLLGSHKLAHEVEVFNYARKAHNLYVNVEDDAEKTLFQEMYRLNVGKGDETSEPFDGAPSKVRITLDGKSPKTYEWPQPNCEERGVRSAGGIKVIIIRDNTIRIDATCNTVTTS